jgi:hypothetical protein
MKLKLKEDSQEWRKTTLLSALGLTILTTLLCWRHVLSRPTWLAIIAILSALSVCALLWPGLFRGYYRVSSRIGFIISQFIGRAVLLLLFFVVLTPMGLALRIAGKDLLRLKPRRSNESYWNSSKETSPLDRLF